MHVANDTTHDLVGRVCNQSRTLSVSLYDASKRVVGKKLISDECEKRKVLLLNVYRQGQEWIDSSSRE